MIVGFDKQEIELLIDDLRCTVRASKEVAEHYKKAIQEKPKQTHWLVVIGRAQGRSALAQEVIDKLSKLIE